MWAAEALPACAGCCSQAFLACRFSPQQLYDVVAEVGKYKEFVPWCQRSVIINVKDPNNLLAELEVGFRMFVERSVRTAVLRAAVHIWLQVLTCSWKLALDWLLGACRYTSEVILQRPNKVISKVSDSTLFDHLDTTWEFKPGPTPNTCWLSFRTDFKFRSPLYSHVASVFFDEVSCHCPHCTWPATSLHGRVCWISEHEACLHCRCNHPHRNVMQSHISGYLVQAVAGFAWDRHAQKGCWQALTLGPVQVVKRMMGAFEGRCQELYGSGQAQPAPARKVSTKTYQMPDLVERW